MPSYAAPGVSDRKHGFFDIYLNSLIHQSHAYDILYAHSTLASITADVVVFHFMSRQNAINHHRLLAVSR